MPGSVASFIAALLTHLTSPHAMPAQGWTLEGGATWTAAGTLHGHTCCTGAGICTSAGHSQGYRSREASRNGAGNGWSLSFSNGAEVEQILQRTLSGGVSINDIGAHAGCDALPFGGVGPSGMGNYHGRDGFRQFSHARAVYRQARVDFATRFGMRPPFGPKFAARVQQFMKS